MEEAMTPAATIRKYAPWLMIISGILMAFTLSTSVGTTSCIGAKSSDIDLPNWNDEITQDELKEYITQNEYILARFGAQAKVYGQYFYGRWTNELVLLKDAKRKNITVASEAVVEAISKSPEFSDKGTFSNETYKTRLGQYYPQKKTHNERAKLFEGKVRNELILKKLKDHIIDKVMVTEAEIRTDFHDKFDTLDFEYIKFPVDFKNSKNPTVEETKDLYKAVKKNPEYMSDNQVKLTYVFFPFKKYETSVNITDEEIKKYYEINKKKYVIKAVKKEVKPTDKKDDKKNDKKDDKKKEKAVVKHKPFAEVKIDILRELTMVRAKALAYKKVSDANIKLSSKPDKKSKAISIEKSFKEHKPAFGEFGVSEYFSVDQGGTALANKMGDTKTLRRAAFSKIGNASIARMTMPLGELLYQVKKSDEKKPASLKFEQVQDQLITELKQKNGWSEAKKKCENFIKFCESEGWKKTVDAKKLSALEDSADISQAIGQNLAIVDEIIKKSIAVGKFTIVKRDQTGNYYLAILFKARKPANDKVYKKENVAIKSTLKDNKISATWQKYSQGIQDVAGIVKVKEKEKKKE